jgi:16S rRNA (uracil1498-N3)-methyltransferase
VTLDGPEGRHAADVRRLRAGERVDLVDGAGLRVEGRVAAVRRGEIDVEVLRRLAETAPDPRLVVVQALAKGDRGELAVELVTELGADVIVPWGAARAVVRWDGERGERALARWRSTAAEAAKQARRAWWPDVRGPATTPDVVALLGAAALGIVLHEDAAQPLGPLPLPDGGDIVVVVGPEGGIADEELALCTAGGAIAVRLGPTVLRTSTAAAAAVSVLSTRLGRWAGSAQTGAGSTQPGGPPKPSR